MTHRTPLAKVALRALADAVPDVTPPSGGEVDDAVAAIARELEAVAARKRRRQRYAAALLAVAAGVVLAFGAMRGTRAPAEQGNVSDVRGGVVVMRGNEGIALARGDTVSGGDHIVAPATATATLALRGGTELRANGGADVVVMEHGASEIFELRAGSVDLHVAKLRGGERFIVRTSDAEVEVRGTQFSVAIGEPCAGTTTRVKVTEGVVVVRNAGKESRVAANESWPGECMGAVAPPPPTPPSAAPPATQAIAPAPTVARPPIPAAAASSDLAEQNRLYADAMAAKRRGDPSAALASLDRLVAAYPRGPLAESAAVERMRILAGHDRSRGADAARQYLARYPNGYARDEARSIAGAP